MNLETYLKSLEPMYDEADQYEMRSGVPDRYVEWTEMEIKEIDNWLSSLEPNNEDIESYEREEGYLKQMVDDMEAMLNVEKK